MGAPLSGRLPPVAGYLDRLSARPGGRLRGFVSADSPGPLTLSLVRVISADPNPAGPGLKRVPMRDRLDRVIDARPQPVAIGSWGPVPEGPGFAADEPRCWSALVWLREPGALAAVLGAESGEERLVLRAGAVRGDALPAPAGLVAAALGLDVRERAGGVRREGARGRRCGRLRDGPCRPPARHARGRGDPRPQRRSAADHVARARGDADRHRNRHGRVAENPVARRDRCVPCRQWRGGVLGRLDHRLRQPLGRGGFGGPVLRLLDNVLRRFITTPRGVSPFGCAGRLHAEGDDA